MSRGGRSPDGFDRIKPPVERLLGREEPDPEGRGALFSATSAAPAGPGLSVHCSRCDAVVRVTPAQALRSLLPLALFAPWRSHPVFAVCPKGQHRAWLRPEP